MLAAMGHAAEQRRMTPAEYLAFDRSSQIKHEYWDGEVFAMSGGSREHSHLQANISAVLVNALRDLPCIALTADMRVRIPANEKYVYPDGIVVCGEVLVEDDENDTLLNPTVLFEVLSDSTESFDRGRKFENYQSITTLTDYVLVAQDRVRVEHFKRQGDGSWLLRILGPKDRLVLEAAGCEIPIEDIYLKVFDFPVRRATAKS
jgi:Uma2 family endonuclease